MSFEENVKDAVRRHHMLENADTVYVGLSGGADSVSLLFVLNGLSAEYGFKLRAVHVNHHLRGAESDRDMDFCSVLCGRLNIPLDIYHVDAAAYSREKGFSLEEGARELRYEIFGAIPDGCRFATAHTLNDSAETVIFNLSRGTGIKGLAGIPPVRDKFIRPLIYCKREEVEGYLAEKGQDFVTDSSNLSDDYSRNKIRHGVIPLLEEVHGGFLGNIRRMTENLAEDCDFMEKAAADAADKDLRTLHPALRRRVMLNFLKENDAEASGAKVSELENAVLHGGKVNLSSSAYAEAADGRLTVCYVSKKRVIFPETPVQVGRNPFLCDKTVIIEENNCEICDLNSIVNNLFTKESVDYDKIQGDVVLRSRRDGDSYVRVNRSFTSRLKKLMNEKYPPEERDGIPVLADEKGIIWVEGFGAADRVKIDENTKKIWNIRIEKNERRGS